MKRHSFQTRLFWGFLVASLVPLLLCSAMLLQIFRLRMTNEARRGMEERLETAAQALDAAFDAFAQTAARLQGNPIIAGALAGGGVEDTLVYNELFSATAQARSWASFDLYDLQGLWRYSTRQIPQAERLPTDWGALFAAAGPGEAPAFVACEDAADTAAPLFQGAVLLADGRGRPAGYLLISMYDSHFRQLLAGTHGAQSDLILLSRYWRPVYCEQPSLAEELAPRLRSRLLAGQSLEGDSEAFLYAQAHHAASGLWLVLQQPQVFTRATRRLLYTVSFGCAVICVAISILMSWKLSRQMFRPIERLHRVIGEVERDNLDVSVPAERDDELGQLARRFNGMVSALKQNREALIENQRELNEAQIRMLQAQLNPHFLCNTLDTMKWISKINKLPQVALMSTDLADILRFCISPDEFVSLRREAAILRRYIEIQRIRMSGAFSFELELPRDLEDCLVPKMILQPIVENAILHGLDGVEDGVVAVTARETAGMLEITVTDNGRGLPPDMAPGRYRRPGGEERKHLGLYNVDTILTKHYGGDCGLYLAAGPGGRGAAVTALLPARREEEQEC